MEWWNWSMFALCVGIVCTSQVVMTWIRETNVFQVELLPEEEEEEIECE